MAEALIQDPSETEILVFPHHTTNDPRMPAHQSARDAMEYCVQ